MRLKLVVPRNRIPTVQHFLIACQEQNLGSEYKLIRFMQQFIGNDTWGSCLGNGHCHEYHEQNLTVQDYHSIGELMLDIEMFAVLWVQVFTSHVTTPPTWPTTGWSPPSATTPSGT